jgi:hypothetical protein
MFGLLMMVGLVVGIGCDERLNPQIEELKEEEASTSNRDPVNRDLVVGTWLAWNKVDGLEGWISFRSNGSYIGYWGDEGSWYLAGDQLILSHLGTITTCGLFTCTPISAILTEFYTVNSVTHTELSVTRERDYDNSYSNSVSIRFNSGWHRRVPPQPLGEAAIAVDWKIEGKKFNYYRGGRVKWEGNNVGGKLEGKAVWYYRSGKVKQEGNYVDGKREGKVVVYYESGKVEWEENYVDDKREGKWVWYDENGNITDEDIYEDGKCIEMYEGDE